MATDVRRPAVALLWLLAAIAIPAVASGGIASPDREVTMRGTLEVVHADDLPAGTARHVTMIRTDDGETSLSFRDSVPERLNGRSVVLEGVRKGGAVDVRTFKVLASPHVMATSATTSAATVNSVTTVNVAVILFDFANDTSEPWSRDAARGVVLTNPDSAAGYFSELTAGKLSLVGDVFGWYRLPHDNAECAPGVWADEAKAALVASGVDISRFDKFVLAFPHAASCDWGGIGAGSDAWINGSLSLHYVAHELGHTFGLVHSKSMSCSDNGVRATITTNLANCSVEEYGDPFDTMGGGSGRHVNNAATQSIGWVDGAATSTITTSGIYSLAPAEGPSGTSPQLLRIRRLDGTWLSLEFRQPYGEYFDTFSATEPVTNGVTLRLTSTAWSGTRILDATPATATFWDAPLTVGEVFDDPVGGLKITTTAVSPTGATVEITIPTVDTQPPSAPQAFTATPATDGIVVLAWTASSDDNAVQTYRISRDGILIAALGADALRYVDSGTVVGRTYVYSVVAVDMAGNVGAQISASATIRDTTAPTPPKNLAASAKGRKVTLTWSPSSDNVGVSGYRVYRNGTVAATVNGTVYADSYSGKSKTSYGVVAFDGAGNVSQASNVVVG
jgi:hypothetical protein